MAVNGIKQHHVGHLIKVPYNAEITLKCSASSAELVTFINTTLDIDNDFSNGLSPYLFLSTNVTIDHFKTNNRGFYSCVSNISTVTPQKVLITSGKLYHLIC